MLKTIHSYKQQTVAIHAELDSKAVKHPQMATTAHELTTTDKITISSLYEMAVAEKGHGERRRRQAEGGEEMKRGKGRDLS